MAVIVEAAWQSSAEWGLYVWLSAVLGARRGEVVALQWADIDLDAGMLPQTGVSHPKGIEKERADAAANLVGTGCVLTTTPEMTPSIVQPIASPTITTTVRRSDVEMVGSGMAAGAPGEWAQSTVWAA
jgi:hypothetical protein